MTKPLVATIEIPAERGRLYRGLEIVPGVVTWFVLLLPVLGSFVAPRPVAIFLIIYILFWLFRAVRITYRLIVGYRQYRRAISEDWLARLHQLPNSSRLRHAVVMACYREDPSIIAASIEALVATQYPTERVLFVLAVEARGGSAMTAAARRLQRRFQGQFAEFLVVVHPDGTPGEVRGKGANITYAGRVLAARLAAQTIDPANVVVTTLDADNRVHPKYLAYLAHSYLTDPDPLHRSYQPLPLFFNNIWDVPLAIRSISVGSSFWQLTESMRPHRLRNFSAHAQSLAGLLATDFWSVRTIVEDGHQFWRTFFRFHGKHSVAPLFVPIYQDAVLSPRGYLATFRQQYIQKRRWAWGVSDFPYIVTNLIRQPSIGLAGWVQVLRHLEGHVSWATTSLMLAIVAWSPIYLSSLFQHTVLGVNYPLLYIQLLRLSLVGLAVTLTISLLMLPPFPRGRRIGLSVVLEYLTAPFLLPITNILFGSLPAIDAQTRLMFGRYLEFRVTEKSASRHDHAELIAKH